MEISIEELLVLLLVSSGLIIITWKTGKWIEVIVLLSLPIIPLSIGLWMLIIGKIMKESKGVVKGK